MKEELKKLNTVPGVIGSLVLDDKGNLLVYDMPAAYSSDKMAKTASLSFMSLKGLETSGHSSSAMEFEFQAYRYIIREFPGGFLCILGTSEISLPVLNISLNIVVDALKHKIDDYDTSSPAQTSAPLHKEFFTILQENLARIIGPLAPVIIEEKLSELGIGKSSLRQTGAIKLLNLLCDEIDNSESRKEFSQEMYRLIEIKL